MLIFKYYHQLYWISFISQGVQLPLLVNFSSPTMFSLDLRGMLGLLITCLLVVGSYTIRACKQDAPEIKAIFGILPLVNLNLH